MISVSVHPLMNRSNQYISEMITIRPGFPMRTFVRRALLIAAILFPVLAVMFLTFSDSALAVTSML